MLRQRKHLALILAIGLFGACNEKPEKKSDFNGSRTRGNPSVPGTGVTGCRSIEAVEILRDGESAVSRVGENSWVLWDLQRRHVKAKGLSSNYFVTNSNGNYLIAKISSRFFKLMELVSGEYVTKRVFEVSSANMPKLWFSADSQFVIVKYRPYGSRLNRFELHDVETGEVKSSFSAAGIEHISIADRGKSVVIGYNHLFDKFIAKHDLSSMEEIFRINLPSYRPFRYMTVSAGRIVAKSRNTYFVYSLSDGEMLYQGRFRHIYETNFDSGMALVANSWSEVAIVDLKDGHQHFTGKSPEEVILSTCRIQTSPLGVACLGKREQNKIFMWDLESGESSTLCY